MTSYSSFVWYLNNLELQCYTTQQQGLLPSSFIKQLPITGFEPSFLPVPCLDENLKFPGVSCKSVLCRSLVRI